MNKSPKKLWKRSLGIVLTAVMVITAALPTAAYGVELNARAGGFSEAIAGTIEILAGNGSSAENGIWLTQSAEGGSADAATAAMEYLKNKYVSATTKIITGSTQERIPVMRSYHRINRVFVLRMKAGPERVFIRAAGISMTRKMWGIRLSRDPAAGPQEILEASISISLMQTRLLR